MHFRRMSERSVKSQRGLGIDQASVGPIRVETRQDSSIHELRVQHERRECEISRGNLAHFELLGLLLVFPLLLRENLNGSLRDVAPSPPQGFETFPGSKSLAMELPSFIIEASSLFSGTNPRETTVSLRGHLGLDSYPFLSDL